MREIHSLAFGNGCGYYYMKNRVIKAGNESIINPLLSLRFNYNDPKYQYWLAPWNYEQINDSLQIYQDLVKLIEVIRASLPSVAKMDCAEVSFHDYSHILLSGTHCFVC
jgi:hypothetical protein